MTALLQQQSTDFEMLFTELYFNLDTNPNPIIRILDTEQPESFGTVTVNTVKSQITSSPVLLVFTIDISSSMSSPASTGIQITKLDYLKQTFINILHYLAGQQVQTMICINTFNTAVESILPATVITSENLNEITDRVTAIRANGGTDISAALLAANQLISEFYTSCVYEENTRGTYQIANIFMSDGEANAGVIDSRKLANMVDDCISNIFIGFGMDYNLDLYREFCKRPNTESHFVDSLENAGMVYGEVLHQFLFPLLKNVEISVTNGHIYNWKLNKWVTSLTESRIIGDAKKMYQIISNDPENMVVTITANVPDSIERYSTEIDGVPDLCDSDGNICAVDLTAYKFRQKTQDLLYRIARSTSHFEKQNMQVELKSLFRELRRYMRLNDKMEDSFLRLLCNDLVVVNSNIYTENCDKYADARSASQGEQRAYSAGNQDVAEQNAEDYSSQRHNAVSSYPQRQYAVDYSCQRHNAYTPIDMYDAEEQQVDAFIPAKDTLSDVVLEASLPLVEASLPLVEASDRLNPAFIKEDEIDNFAPSIEPITCYASEGVASAMRHCSNSSSV
jgi:uncharacterized protein YegL